MVGSPHGASFGGSSRRSSPRLVGHGARVDPGGQEGYGDKLMGYGGGVRTVSMLMLPSTNIMTKDQATSCASPSSSAAEQVMHP